MEAFLLHHSYIWEAIGYWIAFFGIMLEGDGLIFISFFLTYQGFFVIWKLFLILLAGTLIGDVLWYYFGIYAERVHLLRRLLSHARVHLIDKHFLKRPFHAIFISKFAYGVHHITLMRAGVLNFNLKKFIQYDFFSSIIWIAAIGFLGYMSGAGFAAARQYIRFAEIGLLLAIVLFILVEYFIRRETEEIENKEEI